METPGGRAAEARRTLPLVIEAGGTTLRAGLFDPDGSRLRRRQIALTPGPAPGESAADHHWRVLRAIEKLTQAVVRPHEVEAVGIAYPGPLDPQGRVLAAPTVLRHNETEPFDLVTACGSIWPAARVHALNDLTAAGYRYVADGLRDFAVLTVGSGIGHKVFLDGRPRVGQGRGGEIGHLRLDFSPEALPCDCGGHGHLGALASGRGTVALVARQARHDPSAYAASWLGRHRPDPVNLDGHAVAAGFHAGDPFTTAAVGSAVRFLGQALAALHLDTGVEHLILVGGFAAGMGEAYRRLVVDAASAACWQTGQNWDAMVVMGPPEDDAALVGAGLVVCGLVDPGPVQTEAAGLARPTPRAKRPPPRGRRPPG